MPVKPFLILAWLTFFACHTLPVAAQLLIGPEAGGNFSWIAFGDKDFKKDYRVNPVPGYHGGIRLGFQVRKRFYLHTSFLYSTKGKDIKGISDQQLTNRVRYDYIEMPIAYTVDFKGKVGKNGNGFKYFVGIGPNISYWLGGKGSLYNVDFEEANIDKVRYRIVFDAPPSALLDERKMYVESPARLQLGLNLVAGMVFEPQPRQRILVTLRYEYGHSYLSRGSNGIFANTYYQDELESRNQGVRLSVAYLYDTNISQRKKGKSTIKKKRMS
jgi:hypothetical protein